jgi:nitroreductase
MVREKRGTVKISRVACIGCGHCLAICPQGAITLEEIEYQGELRPRPEGLVAPEALLDVLQARRTVRHYRPEPVARKALEWLLQATQYVPTGANCNCQAFTVLTKPEAIDELRQGITVYYRDYARALADKGNPEALAAFAGDGAGAMHEHILAAVPAFVSNLDAGRDRLFFAAPAVILIHARRDEVLPEAACSFAALAIALMAETLGLGTCITAYASLALQALPELRAAAGVPDGHDVHHAVVVGHPAERYQLVPPRRPLQVEWRE